MQTEEGIDIKTATVFRGRKTSHQPIFGTKKVTPAGNATKSGMIQFSRDVNSSPIRTFQVMYDDGRTV